MIRRVHNPKFARAAFRWPLLIAAFFCTIFAVAAAFPDDPAGDTIGAIDGEAIAVSGPMSVEVVRGQIKTILRSGSDVRVKSGRARIDLVEGGQIAICGPAHLSILKSGTSMTIALDTGTIHAHLEHEPTLTVYTAQIQAKPISIGDGAQDVLVGFESPGAMCIRATTGAVRVEQQLAAQSVIVPQGADILLMNGQLDSLKSGAGHCACDLQLAKTMPVTPAQPPVSPPTEISRLATPEEVRGREAATAAKPPAPANSAASAPNKEEPVYQVFMPPLSYDANAKVQRDNFDPKLILLVRRVRVRPTLIYQGSVEGDPAAAQTTGAAANPDKTAAAPSETAKATSPAKPEPPRTEDSMLNRVRAFFHRLWSRSS